MGQKASDTLGGGSSAKPGEKGYVEQAQEAIGSGVKYVQDTANGMSINSTSLNDDEAGRRLHPADMINKGSEQTKK